MSPKKSSTTKRSSRKTDAAIKPLAKPKPLRLLNDHAIGEKSEGRKDALGFDSYASVLANAALGTDGPFTIGIFGEWGTGKTSLMRLIEQKINNEDNVITVWFNAWQYEKEATPVVPLVGTIIQSIERNKDFLSKLGEAGKNLVKSLRAIAYGFSGRAEIQIPGFAKLEAGLIAKEMIDREEALTPDPLIERSLYYRAFDSLNRASLPAETRVVVIIDDLDRCFPDKAIQLLESIKLVLSQPGFIFIMGVARTVLEGYLQHRYRNEYGLSDFDGGAYLDKIVQLAFPLPPHTERMENLSLQILNDVDESARKQLTPVVPIIAKHLGDNPRALIRFVNNVLIDVEISRGVFDREIPLELFATTRCFQLRWRTFYEAVISDREMAKYTLESKREEWVTDSAGQGNFGPIANMLLRDASLAAFVVSRPGRRWLKDDEARERAVGFLESTKRDDVDETHDLRTIVLTISDDSHAEKLLCREIREIENEFSSENETWPNPGLSRLRRRD